MIASQAWLSNRAFISAMPFRSVATPPNRLRSVLHASDFGTKVTLHERPVQGMPLDMFRSLEANDILFIDSTHVLKTGSDVHYELFHILPALAPGVVVHFHDCRFPLEYSDTQIFTKNYSWNEVYAVRALLMDSMRYKVFFSGSLFAEERRALVAETCPDFLRNPGSALWLTEAAPCPSGWGEREGWATRRMWPRSRDLASGHLLGVARPALRADFHSASHKRPGGPRAPLA